MGQNRASRAFSGGTTLIARLGDVASFASSSRATRRRVVSAAVVVCLTTAVVYIWSSCCTDAIVWASSLESTPQTPRKPRSPYTYQPGVTLATHLSTSRLDALVSLSKRWNGPIVAVILVQDVEDENHITNFLKRELSQSDRANIKIITWRKPPYGYDSTYPANFLRNLGMDAVDTRFALLSDVDLEPSVGLYERLKEIAGPTYDKLWKENTALVVPVFELAKGYKVQNKHDIVSGVSSKNVKPSLAEGIEPRSATEWNPSHVWLIDYDKWYRSSEPYYRQINSFENEPYMMLDLSNGCVPYYDERYYYRGGDKQEFAHHLLTLNFSFLILTDHFLAHNWHELSSWRSDHNDAVRTLRTNQLVRNTLKERGGWLSRSDRLVGHDDQLLDKYRNSYAQHTGFKCGLK